MMNNLTTTPYILYDKIIDVTLIRTIPNRQVFIVLGISNEDSNTKDTSISNYTIANNNIVIYHGQEHIQYYEKNGIISAKTKVIAGPTLPVTYKEGWWADETFVKKLNNILKQETSCFINVNNNGTVSKYHAEYLKEDALNTRNYMVTNSIRIPCMEGGIKPSISFSTNMIPGSNCYKLVLKIFNLNLDIDIREITRVEVSAGYRTRNNYMQTFSCPVFSSYIESPNPDGVTVFNCLSVGRTEAFIKSKPVELNYLGGTITIATFLEAVARGLGLRIYDYLIDEYKNIQLNMGKMGTYAENGTAVVNWAREIVQSSIAATEVGSMKNMDAPRKSYPYVMVQVVPDGLVVYALNRRNSDEFKGSTSVIGLDAVAGATFNGVALSVKSLWNPHMAPGSLFRMQPNIINGVNLPNLMGNETYGNSEKFDYIYRCITMSMEFSTNGPENAMDILAIPVQYTEGDVGEYEENKATIEDFASALSSEYMKESGFQINFGSAEDKQVTTTPAWERTLDFVTSMNKMFSIDISSVFPKVVEYEVKKGDTLATIAKTWFNTSGAPDGETYCSFEVEISENTVTKLPSNIPYSGPVIGKSRLWPIIAVLTYRYWIKYSDSKSSYNRFNDKDHLKKTNLIEKGKYVIIPKINGIEQLNRCKDIFKYAFYMGTIGNSYYGDLASSAPDWFVLATELGGTWDD